MDINQDTPVHRVRETCTFDFAWLKNDVSIGQNNSRRPIPFSRLNTLRADGNSRLANG